jgi:hypothetical protein
METSPSSVSNKSEQCGMRQGLIQHQSAKIILGVFSHPFWRLFFLLSLHKTHFPPLVCCEASLLDYRYISVSRQTARRGGGTMWISYSIPTILSDLLPLSSISAWAISPRRFGPSLSRIPRTTQPCKQDHDIVLCPLWALFFSVGSLVAVVLISMKAVLWNSHPLTITNVLDWYASGALPFLQ